MEYGCRLALIAPENLNLPDIPFQSASITARSHPLADLHAAKRTAQYARNQRAQLLHGHGLRGAWIASLAARGAHKPFVFTAHNLAPARAGLLSSFFLRRTVRKAKAVICISQAVADSLAPYGLTPDKTALIPNGIDLVAFDVSSPPTPSLIVAIGRLAPEKGFDTLIEAAVRVCERVPEAHFVLAGEGEERAKIETLIVQHGLTERFQMLGLREDIPTLLASAAVVAVPSLSEGQGLVALEAMAACRPVVASHVGGLVETIEDGVTGLLVPPRRAAALAEALGRLLGDTALREQMGAAGRARVEAHYTADRMVDRTLELYRRLSDRPLLL